MGVWEIVSGVVSLLLSIVSFFVRRLYTKLDNSDAKIEALENALAEHRIEDVANYVKRDEMKTLWDSLKTEMRDLLAPMGSKLQSIEEFLRARKP